MPVKVWFGYERRGSSEQRVGRLRLAGAASGGAYRPDVAKKFREQRPWAAALKTTVWPMLNAFPLAKKVRPMEQKTKRRPVAGVMPVLIEIPQLRSDDFFGEKPILYIGN